MVKNRSGKPRDEDLIPGWGRAPEEGMWQPPPVFLPGESHGKRSLEGYSPWGRKRVRHDFVAKTTTNKQLHLQVCHPGPSP